MEGDKYGGGVAGVEHVEKNVAIAILTVRRLLARGNWPVADDAERQAQASAVMAKNISRECPGVGQLYKVVVMFKKKNETAVQKNWMKLGGGEHGRTKSDTCASDNASCYLPSTAHVSSISHR